jgi:hypothetical protein
LGLDLFSRFFPDQIVLQGAEQAPAAALSKTDKWTFTRLVRDISRQILSMRVPDEVSLEASHPPVTKNHLFTRRF